MQANQARLSSTLVAGPSSTPNGTQATASAKVGGVAPRAGATPLWQLPFENGQRWQAGAPHTSNGNNVGVRGSIDFGPVAGANSRVVAVAAGTVYKVTCSGGFYLGIDHGNGWRSTYYHLTNQQGGLVGQRVEAGTYLGDAGTATPCGGSATFNHVHLTILADGAASAVSGLQFGNYRVYSSGSDYYGYWNDLSGNRVVTNSGAAACCIVSSTLPGSPPPSGPLVASQPLLTTAPSGLFTQVPIKQSFTVKNVSSGALSIQSLTLALRDPWGVNYDQLCATGLTLQPGESKTCSSSTPWGSVGTYTIWPDWQDYNGAGKWHTGDLGPKQTFTLAAVPALAAISANVTTAPSGWFTQVPIKQSFTVKNLSGAAMSIKVLTLALRDPWGVNYDQVCATGLTLQPGESKTCSSSTPWGSVGTYTLWPDWQDYNGAGNWHTGDLGPKQTFTLAAVPALGAVSANVTTAPSGWFTQVPIKQSFTVKNFSGAAMSIKVLTLALRDPWGQNYDQVCATGLTLQPGETKTCSSSTPWGSVGTYTLWPDWQDYNGAGNWHTGDLGPNQTFTLAAAPPIVASAANRTTAPNGWYTGVAITQSFTAKNVTSAGIAVKLLALRVTDPAGKTVNKVCAKAITLAAGQAKACASSTAWTLAGTYTVWPDWQDAAGAWHTGQLGPKTTFTISPK
ncbi:hypothetical protein GCM10009810_12260 [Nostocoides vanveenii]|uniref:M23ase beta-sheet core domain-containing protein n=1 Tax=Nostocoides vanveenii TaxID=330835 RepID=A0ABN2KE09_9MICO